MPDGSLPALVEGAIPLDVLVAPAPFQPRVERLHVAPGMTVAQILFAACQEGVLAPEDLCRTEVDIDGVRILDRAAIASLHPAPGQIVNITVQVYGGGGRGGNKALQAVLQVAVMVAAFAVAGPAGAALGNAVGFSGGVGNAALFTAGQIAGQIAATTAVTLAGSALIQALGSSTTDKATDVYSLYSQSNQKRLREQFPLCLGTRRYAFDLASSAYTTYSGDDMWITAIYSLQYGPCTLNDPKIGETLFSAYPEGEIQTETFLTPGPRNSALYPTNIHQDNLSTTLDRVHGDMAVASTPDDSATLELDFIWGGGLYYSKSDGRTVNADTAIYIEISPYGANAWQPAPGLPAGTDKSGNHYAAGTYYVQAASKTPIRRTCTIPLPSTGRWDVRMHRNTRAVDATDNDAVTWTALRVPKPGLPVLDENLSILVVKVKAAQDFSGSLGVVSGTVTPVVPKYQGGAWLGDPASYDATNWGPSNNAAALTRYLLTGYPARRPMSADEVDATCGEQHDLIAANGWEAGVLLTGGTQQDAMLKLAAAGRMLIYWSGSRLVFVPDWAKDAPKQMFNARNAQGYRRKRTYPDEIHAVWVEFSNSTADYEADGLFVYADGYDAASATLLEKLSLDYTCTPDRAHKEGRVFLAKRALQVWSHEFTAGADAVVSSYGDRVRARRTSGLYGQSDARVSFRRWSGGLVAGVRLDAAVKMKTDESYALDVRRPDGLVLSVAIVTAPGTTRDIVFATPLPEAQAPGKGDLITFGRVNQVTEDLEIIDLSPQSDGTVQIRAANYVGDAIEAAETGAIPQLTTFLSARVAAPTPRILNTSGSPDGVVVAFDVDAQRTAVLRGFVARWRITPATGSASSWNTLPLIPSTQRIFATPPISAAQHETGDSDGEVRVDIELWSVLASGEPSPAATANGILVRQGVLPVTGFDAVGVVRTGEDGTSFPALHVSATPVLSGAVTDLLVELQPASSSPEAWVSAGQPLAAANPAGDYGPVAGGKLFDVRARWRDVNGWKGEWSIKLSVAIPGDSLVATNTQSVGDRTAAALNALATASDSAINAAGTGLAARVTALDGQLNDPTLGAFAKIDSLTTETVDTANTFSLVSRLGVVEADLNTPSTGLYARVASQEYATTNLSNTGSLASRLGLTESALSTPSTGLLARVSDVETATTDLAAGKADASRADALEATVAGSGGTPGLTARVGVVESAVSSLDDQLSAFDVSLRAGTSEVDFRLVASAKGGSAARLEADIVSLGNHDVLVVTDDRVTFTTATYHDIGSVRRIDGDGFGPDGLLMWVGSTSYDAASASKTNAKCYIDANGFGVGGAATGGAPTPITGATEGAAPGLYLNTTVTTGRQTATATYSSNIVTFASSGRLAIGLNVLDVLAPDASYLPNSYALNLVQGGTTTALASGSLDGAAPDFSSANRNVAVAAGSAQLQLVISGGGTSGSLHSGSAEISLSALFATA